MIHVIFIHIQLFSDPLCRAMIEMIHHKIKLITECTNYWFAVTLPPKGTDVKNTEYMIDDSDFIFCITELSNEHSHLQRESLCNI